MSIFNEKQIKAMTSGRYICSECGSVMEFEDETRGVLEKSKALFFLL